MELERLAIEESGFDVRKATHYVQHPVPTRNPYMEQIKQTTVPMLLTDKEKKKLKRLRKQEKIKEKNEKI